MMEEANLPERVERLERRRIRLNDLPLADLKRWLDQQEQQTSLLPSKFVGGTVASDGSIVDGNGFSVTYNGPGDYTIEFESRFEGGPAVVASPNDPLLIDVGPTTSFDVQLIFSDIAAVPTDTGFHFIAYEA